MSSDPSTPVTTEENATSTSIISQTSISSDKNIWPSIGDLNNRVRRLISTCQRNFKKEEQKLVQKAKVSSIWLYLTVFRQTNIVLVKIYQIKYSN